MHFEQFLAEANTRRDGIVDHDRGLAEDLILGWFDVRADIAAVTHQEQGCEMPEHIGEPRQPAADAHVLLHLFVAGGTERDQVLKPVGLLTLERNLPQGCTAHKGAKGCLVMHVMLPESLGRAADLTFVAIPCANALADLAPLRAVVVRVVGPGSGCAQTRHSCLGEGQPVAGGLHFGGRQVEGFLSERFVGVPAAFEEGGHLGGDLQVAPGFVRGPLRGFICG